MREGKSYCQTMAYSCTCIGPARTDLSGTREPALSSAAPAAKQCAQHSVTAVASRLGRGRFPTTLIATQIKSYCGHTAEMCTGARAFCDCARACAKVNLSFSSLLFAQPGPAGESPRSSQSQRTRYPRGRTHNPNKALLAQWLPRSLPPSSPAEGASSSSTVCHHSLHLQTHPTRSTPPSLVLDNTSSTTRMQPPWPFLCSRLYRTLDLNSSARSRS